MSTVIPLFALNPGIDRKAASSQFAAAGRAQIRDFLAVPAAETLHNVLRSHTRWGLAWRAAADGPHSIRAEQLARLTAAEKGQINEKITVAAGRGDYAFAYHHYPMLDAYLEKWSDNEALDLLVEHINSQPLLDLVREVTGLPNLFKADAQATLYAPNNFLAQHDDTHLDEGWRVAYVMSFCSDEWRPDWGGYLLFYDADGDVVAGLKPRFNALNLFRVPQKHSVSFVPPFAPIGRFSITGWFRDR